MKMYCAGISTTEQMEKEYWSHMLLGNKHVIAYAASIDTGVEGYGFSVNKDTCSKHPWNLKV